MLVPGAKEHVPPDFASVAKGQYSVSTTGVVAVTPPAFIAVKPSIGAYGR